MTQDDDQLTGEVQIDETLIGGYRKGPHGRRPAPKTTVLGMVERGGRVSARVVKDVSILSLFPHIGKTVKTGSAVFTDEHQTYMNMPRARFDHGAVNHRTGVFVSGNVHTQTIDGFWSLLKSGIRGVYHQVSPKHLQGYLNEYVWQYNHRDDDAAMFLQLILRAARPLAHNDNTSVVQFCIVNAQVLLRLPFCEFNRSLRKETWTVIFFPDPIHRDDGRIVATARPAAEDAPPRLLSPGREFWIRSTGTKLAHGRVFNEGETPL